MSDAEVKKLEEEVMSALYGQKLGKNDFRSKSCDVFVVIDAKSWIYKGVVLKPTVKMMGVEANEIALEFKENSSLDSNLFTPINPSSIKIKELRF